MAKTSLIITSTADGKTQQKAISDVNPDVSSAKLAQFGTQLVGLTTNTYQKTDRIHKLNCDTEHFDPTPKPEPTLTIDSSDITVATLKEKGSDGFYNSLRLVTTNSDGKKYVRSSLDGSDKVGIFNIAVGTFHNGYSLTLVSCDKFAQIKAQTIYVGVTETENFKGKEIAIEITE